MLKKIEETPEGGACSPAFLALLVTACLLALPFTANTAPRKAELKITKAVDLPVSGIRLAVMSESRESPLPSPSVQTFQIQTGDHISREERYFARHLWIRRQVAGRWMDDSGNTLTVASMLFLLPPALKEKLVTREEFDSATAAAEPGVWTSEDIQQWLADFADASPIAVPLQKRPFNISTLAGYRFTGRSGILAYVFRLNRASAGQSRATQETFAAIFELAPEINPAEARETIEARFVPSITVSQKKPPAAVAPSASFQAPSSVSRTAADRQRSPEFLASREQVIAGIKNSKDWWFAETPNYILLSNLSLKHKHTARQLQEDVELLRGIFAKIIPPRREVSAVSVIRLFADQADYEKYVGEDFRWTSGIWAPDRKELVIRQAQWGGTRQQRVSTLSVVYHEAFHQYLFYIMDQTATSPWFNEGHACLFEAADISQQRVVIEECERFVAPVTEMTAAGSMDFKSILPLDYKGFYAGTDQDRDKRYAQAWAMIYFLRKAAPAEKLHTYDGLLDRYLEELCRVGDFSLATSAVFSDDLVNRLEKDFVAFWKSRNRRSAASRFDMLNESSQK